MASTLVIFMSWLGAFGTEDGRGGEKMEFIRRAEMQQEIWGQSCPSTGRGGGSRKEVVGKEGFEPPTKCV